MSDALVGVLGDHIAGIVDEVAVVAGPADHQVGAGLAVERIVAGIAVDGVDEACCRSPAAGRALHHQIFDIGHEREIDRRIDRVGPLVGVLGHTSPALSTKLTITAFGTLHLVFSQCLPSR